ncbi:MAG: aminopeptidase [Gammaproteobacteria bacterium]|nr:aminopeptidase [Gammaproteobacteria bacterium]
MRHPTVRLAAILAILFLLGGCSQLGYYLQATKGQYRIIADREPVADLVASPDTPEPLRNRLALAERMRQFAVDRMELRGNRGFTYYTDVGRPYVVWNVVAAPAYALTPRTWCFPVAGCVAYKGYFEESAAMAEAEGLKREGLDVIVYGVSAYSTLGWFADPLLNTFIHYPESGLAAVIFHELAHQVIYVKDDSAFNEAFATTVELALLAQWLNLHGDPAEVPALLDRQRREEKITSMVLAYRDRLAEAYLGPDRETRKPALLAEMKREYDERAARGEGTPFYDWWFGRPLNNADLLSISTYHRLVPAFQALLERTGGDFPAFFDEVRLLAELPAAERDAAVSRLMPD